MYQVGDKIPLDSGTIAEIKEILSREEMNSKMKFHKWPDEITHIMHLEAPNYHTWRGISHQDSEE